MAVQSFAQNVKLTGQVVNDEKQPLAGAVVRMYTDTTLVMRMLTDAKGRFVAEKAFEENSEIKDLAISISCLGYESQMFTLQLAEGQMDLGTLTLGTKAADMGEAVVTADRIKMSSEKIVQIPTRMEKSHSANAITLLNQMNISDLQVDIMNGKVKASGKEVPIYINFMPASAMDVAALHPDEIVRVEYNIHPKGELQAVGGPVVNIITRISTYGGRLMTDVTQFEELKGAYKAVYMLYHKKNQFNIGYDGQYRNEKSYSTETQAFHNPVDGTSIVRHSIANGIRQKSQSHSAVFSHYYRGNTFSSNLSFTFTLPKSPRTFNAYLRTQDGMPDFTRIETTNSSQSKSPSLSWNMRKEMKKNQVLNASTSLQYSKNTYDGLTENFNGLTDERTYSWLNKADEDFTSMSARVNYSKQFSDKGTLLAVGAITHNWTSARYQGSNPYDAWLHRGYEYLTLSYTFTIKKRLNISPLLGLSHFVNDLGDTEEKSNDFIFQPDLTIRYDFNKANIVFRGYVGSGGSEDLSIRGNVVQSIDDIQLRAGNPNMKTSRFLTLQLSSNIRIPKGFLQFIGQYFGAYNYTFCTTDYDAAQQKYVQSYVTDGNIGTVGGQVMYNSNFSQKLRLTLAVNASYKLNNPGPTAFCPVRRLFTPFAYGQIQYLTGPFCFQLIGNTVVHDLEQGRSHDRFNLQFVMSYTKPRYSIMLSCNNFTNAARNSAWSTTGPLYWTSSISSTEAGRRRGFVVVKFTFNLQHGSKRHQYEDVDINTSVKSGIMK